ncbi:MAG: DUF1801 domain-containing protein [Polyangiaceae bacterium]
MATKKNSAAKSPRATKPGISPRAKKSPTPESKAKASAKTSAKGPKTLPTKASVSAFLATLDAATRADCTALDRWMTKAAGPGTMYGKAIVGYGSKPIRYADGREVPWMAMGFSPRAQALTLYGLVGAGADGLLAKLGKHTTGKGCLYVKRLSDVDAKVLEKIIAVAARG